MAFEKRNLVAYFLESKLWLNYKKDVVSNYAYWMAEDPERAERMFTNRRNGKFGISISDYIADMICCIYESKLAKSTKNRLLTEIDRLENYHYLNKTEDDIV